MWICYNENKTYAVIYQNGKQAILEESDIHGEELIVYTNKIKYMPSENMEIEKIKFDSITKETKLPEIEKKEYLECPWIQASI